MDSARRANEDIRGIAPPVLASTVLAAWTLLGGCGPDISGPRACEEGFVEHLRVESEQDIADLPPVNRVRRLEIVGSDLETLEGLECIEWVETLRIEDNRRLRQLTGLEGLVEVTAEPCDEPWATIGCVTYPSINAPYRFPMGVGDATIVGNPRIETMVGLDSLTHVLAAFEIRDNASLVSLDGLHSLAYVASDGDMAWNTWRSALRIEHNPRLEGLEALASYRGGARLEIGDNASLSRLFEPRPSYPDYAGGFGMLVLEDLPMLATLEGLADWGTTGFVMRRLALVESLPRMYHEPAPAPGYEELDDRYMYTLVFESNPRLRSIIGLPPVGTIRGPCVVRENDALQDLDGLEALQSVSGNPSYCDEPEASCHAVLIEANDEMRDLDAINPAVNGSFSWVGTTSAIRSNPKLATCLVEQFLDAVYDDPLDEALWTIEGNGDQACP